MAKAPTPRGAERSAAPTGAGLDGGKERVIAGAIPGYGFTARPERIANEHAEADAAASFTATSDALRAFLAGRDPLVFLARAGFQLIAQMRRDAFGEGVDGFSQPEAELLQSIALAMPRGPAVATSPRNMVRGRTLATRNLKAYAETIKALGMPEDAAEALSRQARLQTLFYRNIFNSADAQEIVPDLLARMDRVALEELGYTLSDFMRALFDLLELIPDRLEPVVRLAYGWSRGIANPEALEELRSRNPLLARAWRFATGHVVEIKERTAAAFQLSELAWPDVFTLTRATLEERFGVPIATAFFRSSIAFGELADVEPGRLYLDSPIRRRPFIRLSDDALFLPVPALLVSFPFAIVEHLIEGNQRLAASYSDARTSYLEDAAADLIATALPSARIHRSVRWTDDATGQNFENDIVAVLGNHIFLFEAKSGKLAAATRRGGTSSLRTNFKRLYVEPGQQAARLEALLGRGKEAEDLLRDAHGKPLDIDLSRHVVVHSYGVCIEHLAALTSNRKSFEAIGLLAPADPWSPILSIGELRMIAQHLDTEVSFFHYLTRRSTIEQLFTFLGDDQDLLSVYLTNGFQIESGQLQGLGVIFDKADKPVRGRKVARTDRRVFETPGIQLPPSWRRLGAELYASDSRHRFDMIEAILNQHPARLKSIEDRARSWNAGIGRASQDLMVSHADVAGRTYAVAVTLEADFYSSADEWHMNARALAAMVHEKLKATDCVVLLKVRKSRAVYDAISFFRMRKDFDLAPSAGGPG